MPGGNDQTERAYRRKLTRMELTFTLLCSFLALGFALCLAQWVLKHDDGTPEMRTISNAIREGAEAFLLR